MDFDQQTMFNKFRKIADRPAYLQYTTKFNQPKRRGEPTKIWDSNNETLYVTYIYI